MGLQKRGTTHGRNILITSPSKFSPELKKVHARNQSVEDLMNPSITFMEVPRPLRPYLEHSYVTPTSVQHSHMASNAVVVKFFPSCLLVFSNNRRHPLHPNLPTIKKKALELSKPLHPCGATWKSDHTPYIHDHIHACPTMQSRPL